MATFSDDVAMHVGYFDNNGAAAASG